MSLIYLLSTLLILGIFVMVAKAWLFGIPLSSNLFNMKLDKEWAGICLERKKEKIFYFEIRKAKWKPSKTLFVTDLE